MFQPLELAQIVYQKPFRPLRVLRKDGRTYEIQYPNMAVVCLDTLEGVWHESTNQISLASHTAHSHEAMEDLGHACMSEP